MAGSRTSPNAFTATKAVTSTPPLSSTSPEPTPDFMAWRMPKILPTVAPVPAPTAPSFTAPVVAAAAALSPISRVGRMPALPISRSKIVLWPVSEWRMRVICLGSSSTAIEGSLAP